MKKILSAILTLGLVLSPVSILFQDTVTTVEAKSYKSGKRSFNNNNSNTNTNSFFQKKNNINDTTKSNQSTTANKSGGFFSGGGLMRGDRKSVV